MPEKTNKILFIEGTREDKNGSLRLGFQRLIEQKLKGKMPRILMGEDNRETIRKFRHSNGRGESHVLIDLDGKGEDVRQGVYETLKSNKKNELGVSASDAVYFMVQKMEAWFLSQPEVIKDHFKLNSLGKIPFDHPSKNENPEDILKELTRKAKYKPYHKVKDGQRMLEKLSLEKLEKVFEDVKEMVEKLSK